MVFTVCRSPVEGSAPSLLGTATGGPTKYATCCGYRPERWGELISCSCSRPSPSSRRLSNEPGRAPSRDVSNVPCSRSGHQCVSDSVSGVRSGIHGERAIKTGISQLGETSEP